MPTVVINGTEHSVQPGRQKGCFLLDGKEVTVDAVPVRERTYHVLVDHVSYTVEVVRADANGKQFEVRVNNRRYDVHVQDPYDALLHKLGMDAAVGHKVNDLKAPMPGMVVAIHVTDGQEVQEGDLVVTLEAMKMENTLKAGGSGRVGRIHVKKGQAVEKNEVLVSFA